MTEEKQNIVYGETELTGKLNDRSSDKTEDWHNDWKGKVMVDGVQYYLNAKDRDNGNGKWMSIKLVKVPDEKQPNKQGAQEDVPFDL